MSILDQYIAGHSSPYQRPRRLASQDHRLIKEDESNVFGAEIREAYLDSVQVDPEDITRAIFENTGGLFQEEPRVPSRAMPESGFRVGPRTFRQDTAEIGAMTELDRNVKLFRSIGLEEEFEREVENAQDSWGFDDVIDPVVDFFGILNHPIAGGVEEYLMTGSPAATLSQMGEEFLNALPGISREDARRTTFSDILSGRRTGPTDLVLSQDSPVLTAVAGLIADVLLDPTTYFGFGLAKIPAALGKIDKVAGSAFQANKVTDLVANTAGGKAFRRMFFPNSLVKGLREGYQAEEIAALVNTLNGGTGKLVTPDDVKQGAGDFLMNQIRKDSAVLEQQDALRENVLKIAANMNEGELRLVGGWLDQKEVVKGLIDELKLDDKTKSMLHEGVDKWKNVFDEIFEAEEEVGLLDKAQFRANYSAGMEPITELSDKILRSMFKVRFGDKAGTALHREATGPGMAMITENGIMKASLGKRYPTLESRLMSTVPTEMNVALMATRRGVESIRKVSTQRFYDTILSDTRFAVPIDTVVAINKSDPTHTMLREHGMAIWKAPALSARKAARQATGDDQMYYALPAAMVEQLNDMNKLVQGGDDTNKLFSAFRQVQGLWKAYALMSPGYHMRNLYSNVFNNYLAGVVNPVQYAEAMLLQVGDTKNIGSRGVRSGIERLLGGRKTTDTYMFTTPDGQKLSGTEIMKMAKDRGVAGGGMIFNESDLGIGQELMTQMQIRTGRPNNTQISEGLADWGNRANRIANVKASMFNASVKAGAVITEEQAGKTAEIYDVIARAWAWKNWKTPEEWYENRIREIKAYTVPTAGVPDARFNFLHQKPTFGPPKGPNINTPEFKKASEGMYNVDASGNPRVVLHGTGEAAWTGKPGAGFKIMEEIAEERDNLVGPGVYTTEDFIGVKPITERYAAVTAGYATGMNQGPWKTIQKAEEVLSKDKSIAWLSADEKQKMLVDLQKEGENLILKAKRISDPRIGQTKMTPEEFRLWQDFDIENMDVSWLIGRAGSVLDIASESADFAKKLGGKKYIPKEEMKRLGIEDKLSVIRKKQLAMQDIDNAITIVENATRPAKNQSPAILPLYNFIKNPWVLNRRSKDGHNIIPEFIEQNEALSILNAAEKVIAERVSHLGVDEVQVKMAFGDTGEMLDQIFTLKPPNSKHLLEQGWSQKDVDEVVQMYKDLAAEGSNVTSRVDKWDFYEDAVRFIENVLYEDWENWNVSGLIDAPKFLFNEALQKMGFDGITHAGTSAAKKLKDPSLLHHQVYVAFDPADVKSIYNRGTWDLSVNDLMAQHGEDGLYGAIQFLDSGKADILATSGANPTTFIHELSHLIRRTMLDEGDKDIIHRWVLGESEYNAIRKEAIGQAEEAAALAPQSGIDIEEMATQLMERFVWNVENEEKFARSFEQFFGEGIVDKNVGQAMQGTFDYMKELFDDVYAFSDGGRIGLTPDENTRHFMQNILGRGVESEPETMALARATLETADELEGWTQRIHRKLGNNMFTRANRAFGQNMENNARIAHFIHMLTTDTGKIKGNGLLNKRKTGVGMTPDDAAASVKRFLFDYGELTPFERDVMKSVIPFYTWMRKNIPLQFQQIIENPERYSRFTKTLTAIESMSPQWENLPTPDYFQDVNAIRLPFTTDDIPLEDDGMPTYLALDLPFTDLNRLNMKDMVSSMTPFLKTWAEIYPKQGYSFFLDTEIETYEDEPAIESLFGVRGELPLIQNQKQWHMIKTLLPPVGKLARLGTKASEGRLTEQVLREAMGINIRSVDVDAVVRAKRFQRREVARALKQRLIDKAKLMGFEEAIKDLEED